MVVLPYSTVHPLLILCRLETMFWGFLQDGAQFYNLSHEWDKTGGGKKKKKSVKGDKAGIIKTMGQFFCFQAGHREQWEDSRGLASCVKLQCQASVNSKQNG